MKRWFIFGGAAAGIAVVFVFGGWWYIRMLKAAPYSGKHDAPAPAWTQEELVALTKPGVVRVFQVVKGEAIIPEFDIADPAKLAVARLSGGKTEHRPFSETLSGSGFVYHSDGYIVTNSHVVSQQTIKHLVATKFAADYILALGLLATSLKTEHEFNTLPLELRRIYQYLITLGDQSKVEAWMKELLTQLQAYAEDQSQFTFDKKIYILNPKASNETIQGAIADAFPAQVVSVNDNFLDDDSDYALVKIDQTHLPALALGNSDSMKSGSSVSVFGFPSSAELDEKSVHEASYTTGTINALRDSSLRDFKYFQTDSKLSAGSSGGPMFDQDGKVIGVVTKRSLAEGDTFGFGLPIANLAMALRAHEVQPALSPASAPVSTYSEPFAQAIRLEKNHHCAAALTLYRQALDHNVHFNQAQFVEPHIRVCEAMEASGESVDSLYDERLLALRSLSSGTKWLIGGGFLGGMAMLGTIAFLVRRLRKDETELEHIEAALAHTPVPEAGKQGDSSPVGQSGAEPHRPVMTPPQLPSLLPTSPELEGHITFKE